MIDLSTLGGRIRHIRLLRALLRNDELTLREWAVIVSDRLGRSPPFSDPTVLRWERGARPDDETLRAIAALDPLERGVSWLLFHDREDAWTAWATRIADLLARAAPPERERRERREVAAETAAGVPIVERQPGPTAEEDEAQQQARRARRRRAGGTGQGA